MYKLKLCGNKKAVYIVWQNILGFGQPDICETSGDDDNFTMICSISTRYDAIPNQTMDGQEWDGTTIDLSAYDINKAIAGEYSAMFTDKELVVLSGLFGVEISAFNICEDRWWEDAEMPAEFPYYEYKNGEEVTNTCYDEGEALELDFVNEDDF